jgi:HK97 family phage major capsid protein
MEFTMDNTDLKKMNDERVKLIVEGQALLKKGPLSAEDTIQFDKIMAAADEMKVKIDGLHRVNTSQKDADQIMAKIHTFNTENSSSRKKEQFRASDDYKNTFWDVLKTAPENLSQISYRNVLEVGTGAAGGFLVPKEMHDAIIQAIAQVNFMRDIATTITTANDRDIPLGSSFGAANWVAESGPNIDVNDVLAQKTLKAWKLTKLTRVSDELLQDSAFDLSAYLASSAGKSFGMAENSAMLIGNGTSQPRGITLDGTAFPLGGVAITAPLLIDIYSTLDQMYRDNATWIMHNSTLAAIRKLADTAGAFYFLPSLVVGAPDTILGRPVYTSSYMPALGATNKSIVFGDISYYYIGQRAGFTLQRLMELYAGNNQVGFLAKERVDGLLTLNESTIVAASP